MKARNHFAPNLGIAGLTGVLLLLLSFFAASATAAPSASDTLVLKATFGGGVGGGEGEFAKPEYFSSNGVAIEPGTGNIVVIDETNSRFQVFAPDPTVGGTFLASVATAVQPVSVAVDPGTGAVYVGDKAGVVTRYLSDGAPVPTYTADPSFSPPPGLTRECGGIAVDPVTHEILVSEPASGLVTRLSPSGAMVSSFDASDSPEGPFAAPGSIAVAADGTSYVVDNRSRVLRFNQDDEFVSSLPAPFLPSSVAIDASSGEVYVGSEIEIFLSPKIVAFTAAGAFDFQTSLDQVRNAVDRGLAVNPATGFVYSATGQSLLEEGFNGVSVYQPAVAPGVEMLAVSQVTSTGAHLSGAVDPGPVPPGETMAHFEYSGNGGQSWEATPDQPADTSPIESDINGLSPNREYAVRLVASNSLVTKRSAPISFTTTLVPPLAETGPALEVGPARATLTASIDAFGAPTTYHFEYGLTTAYGSRAPVAEASTGGEHGPRTFSRAVTNLTPGTTYHYRVVAENPAGITNGADRTFTTPVTPPPNRAYEQVTPVNKQSSIIDPFVGFQAKDDGTAVSYMSRPAAGEIASNPWFARSMSVRGAIDWAGGRSLDPPLAARLNYSTALTLAVSEDFGHTFVATNRALAPGAVEGAANLYVVDLATGIHQLVVTSEAPEALATFIGLGATNKYVAGAPDFQWVVFDSYVPLLAGVTGEARYRWTSGEGLELESVLPDGSIPSENVVLRGFAPLQTVSADGTKVYFTLSSGAGAYLREGGQTRAISVSQVPGDPQTVQPAEVGLISKDGRFAFLTSTARLTVDAPDSGAKLYRYDASSNQLEYVAMLNFTPSGEIVGGSEDGQTVYYIGPSEEGSSVLNVWRNGEAKKVSVGVQGLQAGYASVSPNGRYLTYLDKPGQTSSGIQSDVYAYDADAEELACVSCFADGKSGFGLLPNPEPVVSNQIGDAVDDQGRFFFDSQARLLPRDANGDWDVYMYRAGTLSLISPGSAPHPARLLGIARNGDDVFFSTSQGLVGQDRDERFDIYDARVGGGLSKQNPDPIPACVGESCQGSPSASPPPAGIASEAVKGIGGRSAQKRCGKGRKVRKVKGKVRCVKKQLARHGKRAGGTRRTGA